MTQQKDFGVILNTRLGASEQTKESRKKALRMLGAIYRNVSYISEEVIRKLYCACQATFGILCPSFGS